MVTSRCECRERAMAKLQFGKVQALWQYMVRTRESSCRLVEAPALPPCSRQALIAHRDALTPPPVPPQLGESTGSVWLRHCPQSTSFSTKSSNSTSWGLAGAGSPSRQAQLLPNRYPRPPPGGCSCGPHSLPIAIIYQVAHSLPYRELRRGPRVAGQTEVELWGRAGLCGNAQHQVRIVGAQPGSRGSPGLVPAVSPRRRQPAFRRTACDQPCLAFVAGMR